MNVLDDSESDKTLNEQGYMQISATVHELYYSK